MRGTEGGREPFSPSKKPYLAAPAALKEQLATGRARPNNDNGNWTILYYSLGLKSHDDGGRLEEEERARGRASISDVLMFNFFFTLL